MPSQSELGRWRIGGCFRSLWAVFIRVRRSGEAMVILLAAVAFVGSAAAPVVNPHWKFAYEKFDADSIWYSTADGKYDHLLIRHGRCPSWSPDGRRIAYVRGREIRIRTLGSGKHELLTKIGDDDIRDSWGSIEWSDRDGDHPDVYLDWDPKHPVLLVSTGSST